jgi:CheY-like chemotaxis protein/signal transduction histidine kinase
MLTHDEFAQQVRQALENLHDFVRLQNLPLVANLSASGQTVDQSVRRLRTELLDAIERLNPSENLPPRAKERRAHTILYGRYVQGLTTSELVEELAISVRQLRREHKQALGAVVGLLWERLSEPLAPRPHHAAPLPGRRGEAAAEEAAQLISRSHVETIFLPTLVRDTLALLDRMAAKHGVTLRDCLPDSMPAVRGDRVVLRQALVEILSYAMDRAAAGTVAVSGGTHRDVWLKITGEDSTAVSSRTGVSLDVSRRLIVSLGGRVEILDTPARWSATVHLPVAREIPILVMDDNAGLVQLFRRYLAGRSYQVVEAHTLEDAVDLIHELDLRLIILDIMMPNQDGWEILQGLQGAPGTRDVPILVCSVLNEADLAFSLGASDYLAKPVTQDALLTKVERWCNVPPGRAGPPPEGPADSAGSPSS